MARQRDFTVDELLIRVRVLGDWQNLDGDYSDAGSYMSSGTLMRLMDQAHEYAWNEYAESDEEWNVKRYTFATANGTAEYSLPSDLHLVRGVEAAVDSSDSGWIPLARATVDDDGYVGSSAPVGGPTSYRLLSGTIELLPTPGDSRNVRLSYEPACPVISSSLQTVDGLNGFSSVVIFKTVVLGKIREEKPYGDVQNELNETLAQMRRIAKRRDRGTPAHTRDRRDSSSRWPRRFGR